MEYIVPQFIEKESKIIGPLNFKQFVFVGTGVVITLFFYLTIGKTNFFLFVLLAFLFLGNSLALAFLKIKGFSLPKIIQNSFFFLLKPKKYFWQKKNPLPTIIKTTRETKKEKPTEDKGSVLKVAEKSRLREINKFLEVKTR